LINALRVKVQKLDFIHSLFISVSSKKAIRPDNTHLIHSKSPLNPRLGLVGSTIKKIKIKIIINK